MEIKPGLHLTYCSNIHPGESWKEVFEALKINIPPIRNELAPQQAFGIGLRLSAQAATELLQAPSLDEFKSWLKDHNCYVFTINGFVYGGFHNSVVKENVYKPDWSSADRVNYTMDLVHILTELIPEGAEAGISTSPVSYKPWIKDEDDREDVLFDACMYLAHCVKELHLLKMETGKHIHLDIEPEPGCLLENTKETIFFLRDILVPIAARVLKEQLGFGTSESREVILQHIKVCYDVCHFAVEYEDHEKALKAFSEAGIGIGKVQISSALKVLTPAGTGREALLQQYRKFAESTYLHQTIAKNVTGELVRFDDLPSALEQFGNKDLVEWRTHYHVPVFMRTYDSLTSTQEDIIKTLDILKKTKFTNHLEVETYTWEVLPKQERLPLQESIKREMKWVMDHMARS